MSVCLGEPFRLLAPRADHCHALPSIKGYRGQKSAPYALVRELRPRRSGLLTRFEAVPREFTQHDFGEVRVTYLDGTTERPIFFATRLKYSRWAQVSLVPNQRAETLVRAI